MAGGAPENPVHRSVVRSVLSGQQLERYDNLLLVADTVVAHRVQSSHRGVDVVVNADDERLVLASSGWELPSPDEVSALKDVVSALLPLTYPDRITDVLDGQIGVKRD